MPNALDITTEFTLTEIEGQRIRLDWTIERLHDYAFVGQYLQRSSTGPDPATDWPVLAQNGNRPSYETTPRTTPVEQEPWETIMSTTSIGIGTTGHFVDIPPKKIDYVRYRMIYFLDNGDQWEVDFTPAGQELHKQKHDK